MRLYRIVWDVALVATLVAAWVGGVVQEPGWGPMVAVSALIGVMGGLFRFTWVEEATLRSRTVLQHGAAFTLIGSLVVGLPAVAGAWTLVVVALLGALAPESCSLAARWVRARRPLPRSGRLARWTDAQLEQRWRTTAQELRHPAAPVARRVALVEERAHLLDELERRDPRRFQAQLARAGWDVSER